MATTNYTATYEISRDGIDPLALPYALDQRLMDAIQGEDLELSHQVEDAIDEEITAQLRIHGVHTDERLGDEWLGDWSAAEIVTRILDRFSA